MTVSMKRLATRLPSSWLCTLAVAVLLFAADQPPSFSQETTPETQGNTEAVPTPELRPELRTLPPAYESQLLRLAEALGALHYLRNLCGEEEGQTWRVQMEALMTAEEPNAQRRAQLIANFNRGFRGYQEIYRECTKPASEAANQFLQQAMRLSAEIPNRFGR